MRPSQSTQPPTQLISPDITHTNFPSPSHCYTGSYFVPLHMLFPWYRELFLLCLENSYLLFKTQIKVTAAGKPSLTGLVPNSREKVTYLWDVWKQVGLAIQVPHPQRMDLEVSEGSMCEQLPHVMFQSIVSA